MQTRHSPVTRWQLNTRLLPALVGLLLLVQLIVPYRGWVVLLAGLGSTWLVSYLWVRSLARSLQFTREMRFGWAQVGDQLEERFTLTNTGWAPGLWVEVLDHSTLPDYQSSLVTGVGSHSHNYWQTHTLCSRRGVFTLGPTSLATGDPFGLYTVHLTYPDSTTLTVTPPVISLPTIDVAPGGRSGEGRPRPNTLERTVSAAGVRDYLPGDSLHWIHWPTSARRGSLYTRLFEGTPAGDWWIFLDLDQHVQVGPAESSTEEASIILAASLASRGVQAGRAVGLIAHGQEAVWLPPQMGDTQLQQILRALALVRPGPHPLAELLAHMRPAFGQLASLIVITPAVHNEWVEALVPLLRRGAVATVLLLDPQSFGGSAEAGGTLALLAELGVARYLITRDLLDRPESRPGRQGQWEWRISPRGRAIPINQPRDLNWRRLV